MPGERQPFEYECYQCGYEEESFDSPVIPLRDCPECDDILHHVGPIIAECDHCGAGLLYVGNPGLGGYQSETLCDNCYDRMASLRPDGGLVLGEEVRK